MGNVLARLLLEGVAVLPVVASLLLKILGKILNGLVRRLEDLGHVRLLLAPAVAAHHAAVVAHAAPARKHGEVLPRLDDLQD